MCEVFCLNFGSQFFCFRLLFFFVNIFDAERREKPVSASGVVRVLVYIYTHIAYISFIIRVHCSSAHCTPSRKLKTRVSHFYRPGQSEIYCSWTDQRHSYAFSIVSKPWCGLCTSRGDCATDKKKEGLMNFFFSPPSSRHHTIYYIILYSRGYIAKYLCIYTRAPLHGQFLFFSHCCSSRRCSCPLWYARSAYLRTSRSMIAILFPTKFAH